MMCLACFITQTLNYLKVVYKAEWANFVERIITNEQVKQHLQDNGLKLPPAADIGPATFSPGAVCSFLCRLNCTPCEKLHRHWAAGLGNKELRLAHAACGKDIDCVCTLNIQQRSRWPWAEGPWGPGSNAQHRTDAAVLDSISVFSLV